MRTEENLPWTTTRCNRVLRPISSRLATLRKELNLQRRVSGEDRNVSVAHRKKDPSYKTNFTQPANARKPRGFEKARDPDWVPGAKAKTGLNRTYGGRPKKATAPHTGKVDNSMPARPGEIAFTPLLLRTENKLFTSPQLQDTPLGHRKGPLIKRVGQIKYIKRQMPADVGKLVEGLLDAFAKLLQVTHAREPRRRQGARSLLSTCLHMMPAYVELEEHFAELDKEEIDDDDRDIAREIYTHLEDQFGSQVGQGWPKLQAIVRAHGTSLLCDAFADNVLGLETLHAVVDLCMKASAWDEAEKFLWTFLPVLKPLPSPTTLQTDLFCQSTSVYMYMSSLLVEYTGRHGFLYDLLEHMVSQELLPLEWLATECMRPMWSRLVRTLSDGDSRTSQHAFRFIETSLLLGMGLPDESVFEDGLIDIVAKQTKPSIRNDIRNGLCTTFSSLLTVLSGIALVSHNRSDDTDLATVERIAWILDSLAVSLLKRGEIRYDLELLEATSEIMQTLAQRALWAVFASFLVRLNRCSLSTDMVQLDISALTWAMSWISRQYSSHDIDVPSLLATLPEAIVATAHCAGKAWHNDGFDQLQRFIDALLSISGLRLPHKLWSFKRLALEASSQFAEVTNNREHAVYARQIETAMRSDGRIVLTHSPQKNESPLGRGGFRWEEGIGEWVVCTPFAKQELKRVPKQPMRQLRLLPTPAPSESSELSGGSQKDMLPTEVTNSEFVQSPGLAICLDEPPRSSPIKKASLNATRKRRRGSPIVLVPLKRTKFDPPKSPLSSFDTSESQEKPSRLDSRSSADTSPNNAEEMPIHQARPQRRGRVLKQITKYAKNPRLTSTRQSLDSSLRNIARKLQHADIVNENDFDDLDDELGKTPAGIKRQKGAGRKRGWPRKVTTNWLVYRAREKEVDVESEDELSFH